MTVAWKASVAALGGSAIGVPGGIALGHSLWGLFARDIYAVARPSVPVVEVVVIALVAIVLANLVAAIRGPMAAAAPAALAFRRSD